ncbi:hypothetical protein F4808DRAFT_422861 [Astrocystis sublimbata]|nr:hypothetical protein F4808DRAFT_422861 [Astrocystis sublimbata]
MKDNDASMAEPTEALSEDDLAELSLLRDFEADAMIAAGFLNPDEQLSRPLDHEIVIKFEEMELKITAGTSYPACKIIWSVENHTLSRKSVDSLRGTLRGMVESADSTNNLSRWQNREAVCEMGVFDPVQIALKLAQTAQAHVGHPPGWLASDNYLPFRTRHSVPLDTTSASDQKTTTTFQLLQKTPREICAMIPPQYRVLHIEPILRGTLVTLFENARKELSKSLSELATHQLRPFAPGPYKKSAKDDIIKYLLRPQLTFHGTTREHVASIVRHGFLLPGIANPMTKQERTLASSQSRWGRGIYSSPSATFSLGYVDESCPRVGHDEFFGAKLLVCATIMGRSKKIPREDSWEISEVKPDVESYIANDGKEWIVFSPAHIIPVYLIHIDWRVGNKQYLEPDE